MNSRNARPVISPRPVIVTAMTMKTSGSETHVGSPVGRTSVKKMRSLEEPSIFAGNSMMKATRTSRPIGTKGPRSRGLRERRKPSPMPRNDASRIRLEK